MHSEDDQGASGGVLDLLSLLSSGGITVTVAGYPLLSIDTGERALDLEVQGAKEAGLRLSDLIKLEEQDAHLLRGSESVARKLSQLGWKLTLYNKGDRVMALGSGISRLTGHQSVNLLNLKGLLDALK